MEKQHITELAQQGQAFANMAWSKLQTLYPKLKGKPVPTIVINNRLKTTGGRACGPDNTVELSAEMYFYNQEEYYREIIPHELIHIADWLLTGNMGHGQTWKMIMQAYGLPGDRCHDLVNPLQVKRDIAKGKVKAEPVETIERKPESFSIGMRVKFAHTNRQRVTVIHKGTVTKVNRVTIKVMSEVTGTEWTVPLNTKFLEAI